MENFTKSASWLPSINIDFAGNKLSIIDVDTGKFILVEVIVAILPCSQLTYVEAVASQRKEDLILLEGETWYSLSSIHRYVGVAIGRRVLIAPIRKGADPYGLFGKYQGIQSKNKDSHKIAEEIFKIVATNEKSKSVYTEMIRNLVLNAKNEEEGAKWMKLLDKIPNIEIAYISELQSKFHSNDNLNNDSIFEIANRIFKKYNLALVSHKTFMVNDFNLVDDLPF